MTDPYRPTVAAIVPCYNEEAAIGTVVRDLRLALPDAEIYVYDNASTDATVQRAEEAGAIVRSEPRKGKGNVVRRAFADIDADVVVLIDGDDTYDATRAGDLVATLLEGPYDHVLGVRSTVSDSAYRPGHAVGNRLLTGVVGLLFGREVSDMLSGYRAFSRRYVKSFPALSQEFETETEMTVHALRLRLPAAEVVTDFKDRAAGSESKLRTYRDGWRILKLILALARRERPALFHGVIAALVTVAALALGTPVIVDYLHTGEVARFPTAILASAMMIIATVTAVLGYTLDALAHSRQESARLAYLRFPAPGATHPVRDL
ncbi:glycosyltransferase [Nostocoides sp. HKS02]|uniref:glycosyltransferase n=1 Tax=Nostocoides sp. HKS02 TaxID=1813880 RepID=UPI0012B49706|nr:glycosyltransferase [Tetrasphaera sp. HKS02]QGN56997.1 glycosyltransferase [Tetrasphaera sp. HKS02]